jgi:RNA recognition motif-containing protein
MGARLYVGNLSYDATADSLRAAFSKHGEVSHVVLMVDRDTGRHRGFAFITMGSAEQASVAVTKMNGAMLDGRPLRVNEAERGGVGGRRVTRKTS